MGRSVMRLVLGGMLVLHGLGNAVLPLRGVGAIAPGVWAPAITALYILAIVGFVAAGLGVLRVSPFDRFHVRCSVAAGIAAIAVWLRLGHTDLWVGLALNALLPIAVMWWTTGVRDERASVGHAPWPVIRNGIGLAFFAWIVMSAALWPWHRTWGTEPAEWAMSLPGDRSPRTPALELLHGVSIDAPPAAVWPWLVQLGQDRAGFYSYDRLERLFGADVHNVREIRPEWQARGVGDFVPATQAGYLGGLFGNRPGWTVDAMERERVLVLRYWGAFVLQPVGTNQTRLLIRSTISNERIPAWAAAINFAAFELPHFIMQRRMMLTLKALAER